MIKYKVIKNAGAKPGSIEKWLNQYAEEEFYLEFVDNGYFVMAKWESEEKNPEGEEE